MEEKLRNTECVAYEIRNSLWKNVALLILSLGLELAAALVLFGSAHRDWSSVAGVLFFGAGVVLFGFKAFDRRTKIYADSQGIRDFRTSFGMIAWNEVESVTSRTIKGNTFLTLYFRSPDKWLGLSSRWTQWMVSKTKMKFGASISLQNTDVDEQQFASFIDAKIAASSKTRRDPKILSGRLPTHNGR